LGPHVHGTSSVNIAIEGGTVSIDLDAPGMDIVGFEHEASTTEQQAAMDTAVKALNDPIALFGIPAEAGCTVSTAEAGLEEHEHEEEEHADEAAGAAAEHAEEAHHSDFAGAFTLACTDTAAVTALDFSGYFASFAGTQQVNVQLVSDSAQLSGHVDRSNTKLNVQ
jgi:hypothetical protein